MRGLPAGANGAGSVAWGVPGLGPGLQHLLCVLVVAAAIKLPLNIPLYWHALLLAIGLFGLVCLQSLPRIMLWMVVLVGLGAVQAVATGNAGVAVPRLAQLFLMVMAAAVIARLDPDLLIRYLVLLLPVIVLVGIVELLLPEPLFARRLLGETVQRQGGIYGDPNYSAMLYGVVGLLLLRRPPRLLGLVPLALTIPTLSRGVLAALLAWLATCAAGRLRAWFSLAIVILLLLQPFIVAVVLARAGETLQATLASESSLRLVIWSGYLQMGLIKPLGVGYFTGPDVMPLLVPDAGPRFAHSIFMQVFGEFGWVGYLVFCGFVLHLTLKVAWRCPAELPLLIFLLTGYALINGLSDWAFWVPIGYVLARLSMAPERP